MLLWNWLTVGVLAAFMFVVEGRGWSSIALTRPSSKDVQWAVFLWGISAGISGLVYALVPPAPAMEEGLDTVVTLPLPVLAGLVLTTATTEEILFRGYSVERLRELTGRLWIAIAVSFTLFVAGHVVYFGPQWLMYHGLGVVVYVLYVTRRNLWACMIMHFLGKRAAAAARDRRRVGFVAVTVKVSHVAQGFIQPCCQRADLQA